MKSTSAAPGRRSPRERARTIEPWVWVDTTSRLGTPAALSRRSRSRFWWRRLFHSRLPWIRRKGGGWRSATSSCVGRPVAVLPLRHPSLGDAEHLPDLGLVPALGLAAGTNPGSYGGVRHRGDTTAHRWPSVTMVTVFPPPGESAFSLYPPLPPSLTEGVEPSSLSSPSTPRGHISPPAAHFCPQSRALAAEIVHFSRPRTFAAADKATVAASRRYRPSDNAYFRPQEALPTGNNGYRSPRSRCRPSATAAGGRSRRCHPSPSPTGPPSPPPPPVPSPETSGFIDFRAE